MRNQAPLPRAAHYITPPGRSQVTSTRASPSPPMRDPISRSEHRTPEPQQSNRPATLWAYRRADEVCRDMFDAPEAHDGIGDVRRLHVEGALRDIARRHGAEVRALRNEPGT